MEFMEAHAFKKVPDKPEEMFQARKNVKPPLTPMEEEIERLKEEQEKKEAKKKKDAKKAGKKGKKAKLTERHAFLGEREQMGPSDCVLRIQEKYFF